MYLVYHWFIQILMVTVIAYLPLVRYNRAMFIVGILSWWYGAGWRNQLSDMQRRVANCMDFFSIDLLLRTLFSPFRQISAGGSGGPLAVQLRAVIDGLISRIIGAFIRIALILVGLMAIVLTLIIGSIGILAWAIVPLLPAVGILLSVIGWAPWK